MPGTYRQWSPGRCTGTALSVPRLSEFPRFKGEGGHVEKIPKGAKKYKIYKAKRHWVRTKYVHKYHEKLHSNFLSESHLRTCSHLKLHSKHNYILWMLFPRRGNAITSQTSKSLLRVPLSVLPSTPGSWLISSILQKDPNLHLPLRFPPHSFPSLHWKFFTGNPLSQHSATELIAMKEMVCTCTVNGRPLPPCAYWALNEPGVTEEINF